MLVDTVWIFYYCFDQGSVAQCENHYQGWLVQLDSNLNIIYNVTINFGELEVEFCPAWIIAPEENWVVLLCSTSPTTIAIVNLETTTVKIISESYMVVFAAVGNVAILSTS